MLLTNQVPLLHVLPKDRIKEEGVKNNTVKGKGLQFQADQTTMYYLVLPIIQTPLLPKKSRACTLHKENCLGILRSVTVQWRRLTVFTLWLKNQALNQTEFFIITVA